MATAAAPRPGAAGSSSATSTGMRRDVGRLALLFVSVGSVIGSGWLLGALNATTAAGPAAIVSWVLGALGILVLALVNAELGAMFPESGGMVRYPHYAFGSLVGFAAGWVYWLGSVTLAPIETEAALQYGNKYVDKYLHFNVVHEKAGQVVLTAPGFAVGIVLLAAFVALNLWGVKRFSETNTPVVAWKIAIPVLALIVLAVTQFKGSNFSAGDGFAPAGVKGILTAIASGGVIFSYLGFEQAIQFGGESRNPGKNIPFALIGSLALGVVVYLLLQVAFVGALDPHDASHGWAKLSFANSFGPYAGLATTLGLGWLAVILYIDAFISPAGTGLVYTGSSARVLHALDRNGYWPRWMRFGGLNGNGVPMGAVVASFVVGVLVFLPFPGWQKLVTFITSASVLIFATQCVTLTVLRERLPDRKRPYRLPAAPILAPLGFVIADLIVLWAGWQTDKRLLIAVLIGFAIMGVAQLTRSAGERIAGDWASAAWLAPWLAGLGVISWASSFKGHNHLKFGVDMVVMAVFSLLIYAWAIRSGMPKERIEADVEAFEEADGGESAAA